MTDAAPDVGPLKDRKAKVWKREPHDWYQEPWWCSARLFQEEPFRGEIIDPAAGAATIVKTAIGAGFRARGFDLVVRSPSMVIERDWLEACSERFDNIVSNPPFGLCDDKRAGTYPFVQRCLERAERKVALLLPAKWIQSDKRSRWLETTPLRRVWFMTPRPSMPPGHILAAGGKPGNGKEDFAWYIWLLGYDGPAEIRWLRKDP
jgi:hypothetical protein